jgi:hypothetical protein
MKWRCFCSLFIFCPWRSSPKCLAPIGAFYILLVDWIVKNCLILLIVAWHKKNSTNCKWISLNMWGLHVPPCNISQVLLILSFTWLILSFTWLTPYLGFGEPFLSFHITEVIPCFCFLCTTPHTEVIDIDLISIPFGAYDHPLSTWPQQNWKTLLFLALIKNP